ncbi:four helix bundle protein [Candidatus Saccharibacteria bacterium]|nr:MAG: four helix bundle protein [Candidatus Saccharibacteria bacterium]
MSDIQSFRDLVVWQKAIDFVDCAYDIVHALPVDERFVLSDQLRRSAISIPSNIAEGSKRGTRSDFRNFTRIALGSAAEAEAQ